MTNVYRCFDQLVDYQGIRFHFVSNSTIKPKYTFVSGNHLGKKYYFLYLLSYKYVFSGLKFEKKELKV